MPPLSFEFALLAGRAVFLILCFVLAAIAFVRLRRTSLRQHAALTAQTAEVLQRLIHVETRIDATQASLTALTAAVAALQGTTTAPAAGNSRSYEIAIRMARGGASREELMGSCGITRQEAELVQRLHAPKPRPLAAVV